MTTELEQQFFKVFGIKKVCDGLDCGTCLAKCQNGVYPEITAEKLIKLICIKSKDSNGYRISANNYKTLKADILKDLMNTYSTYTLCTWEQERAEKLKQQVRSLFEEGE